MGYRVRKIDHVIGCCMVVVRLVHRLSPYICFCLVVCVGTFGTNTTRVWLSVSKCV
jgi:hypothetical protein